MYIFLALKIYVDFWCSPCVMFQLFLVHVLRRIISPLWVFVLVVCVLWGGGAGGGGHRVGVNMYERSGTRRRMCMVGFVVGWFARCTCNGKCETLAARVKERRWIQEVSTRMVRLQQEVNQIKPTPQKKKNRPRRKGGYWQSFLTSYFTKLQSTELYWSRGGKAGVIRKRFSE